MLITLAVWIVIGTILAIVNPIIINKLFYYKPKYKPVWGFPLAAILWPLIVIDIIDSIYIYYKPSKK